MTSLLSYTLHDGGSGPLLVLSHALGMDREAWAPLRAQLGPQARILAFDHPGHGGSPPLQGAGSMDALVEAAAALLREVAREPVVWVGISMGAMVGMGLAIRHPSLLRGLVVAHSTAHYPDAGRALWDARIATVRREGMAAIADAVMGRYFHADFVRPGPRPWRRPVPRCWRPRRPAMRPAARRCATWTGAMGCRPWAVRCW